MAYFGDPNDDSVYKCDRPASITRKEAEKICRQIISNHLGENLPENLFQDSVNELMEEINGATVQE